MALLNATAVAHDYSLAYEIVVYALGICHACKEEVGIGGEHFFADWQLAECFCHSSTLLKDGANAFLYFVWILEYLNGLLLGKLIDVVWVFHFVVNVNDFFARKCHA